MNTKKFLLEHTSVPITSIIMEIFIESPDVVFKRVFYNWYAISADIDDNKFFYLAVATSATYLVTNDLHFNETKKLQFPIVNIISASDFLAIVSLL